MKRPQGSALPGAVAPPWNDKRDNGQQSLGGWSYNSNNQLTAASGGLGGLPAPSGCSYDLSGNQTGLNGMSLSYDGWGQLAGVQNSPSGTVSFTTDSAGRRVSKTANGQSRFYLYDGDVLVAELDSSGTLKATYTWGFQGLISDRVPATGGAASRFYEYDAMGNTRALLDQAGNVLGLAAYTAWGSRLSSNLPQTPFGYQGRWGIYSDGETGLLRMGARYYSPGLGRFLSRDSAGFLGGPNVYAYCCDDPVDFYDRTGQGPEEDTGTMLGQAANFYRPYAGGWVDRGIGIITSGGDLNASGPLATIVNLHDSWDNWGYMTQDCKATPLAVCVAGGGALLQAGSVAGHMVAGAGALGKLGRLGGEVGKADGLGALYRYDSPVDRAAVGKYIGDAMKDFRKAGGTIEKVPQEWPGRGGKSAVGSYTAKGNQIRYAPTRNLGTIMEELMHFRQAQKRGAAGPGYGAIGYNADTFALLRQALEDEVYHEMVNVWGFVPIE